MVKYLDKTINSSQMSNMLGLKSAEKQGWPQTEEGIGGKEYEEIFLESDRCKKASLFREAFSLMVLIPRIELGTSSLPRMRSTD